MNAVPRTTLKWFTLGMVLTLFMVIFVLYAGSWDKELKTCPGVAPAYTHSLVEILLTHKGDIPERSVFLIDIWVNLRAGCALRHHLPVYLKGEWSKAQPVNPNTNHRLPPWITMFYSFWPESSWRVVGSLMGVLNVLLGAASIPLLLMVMLTILPNIDWAKFLVVGYFASILLIQYGYGNLDPTALFLSSLLLLCILLDRPREAGIVLAIIVSLKLHLWAWPIVIYLVRGQLYSFLKTLAWAGITLAVLIAIFLIVYGPEYGLAVIEQYRQFIVDAPKNIAIYGQEFMFNVFNNSLEQTLARYFGVQPWISNIANFIRLMLLGYLGQLILFTAIHKRDYANFSLVALLVAVQTHIVFMVINPQVETAMIIVFVFPLLLGLRTILKVRGIWALCPYYFMILPLILYMVTHIQLLNLPFSFPITLVTFAAMGLIIDRTIQQLRIHDLPNSLAPFGSKH